MKGSLKMEKNRKINNRAKAVIAEIYEMEGQELQDVLHAIMKRTLASAEAAADLTNDREFKDYLVLATSKMLGSQQAWSNLIEELDV